MKIVVAGSSGLIGKELVAFLQKNGHTVKHLVRSGKSNVEDEYFWDPEIGIVDSAVLEDCDGLVNLAGENIAAGRWNDDKKRRILESRIDSTYTLATAINKLQHPPKVWINASAIGYYGDRGNTLLQENSSKGSGFLAYVCQEWEQAVEQVQKKGVRIVYLRTGMVLSTKGGGLAKMILPFKLGLGGKMGSGEQYISWITLEDLVNIILFILTQEQISGPVNAVTPNPVTNAEFTKTLGLALKRPTFMTLPASFARLVFGEVAEEVLLASQRVLPSKLLEAHYPFIHPHLKEALQDLILPTELM